VVPGWGWGVYTLRGGGGGSGGDWGEFNSPRYALFDGGDTGMCDAVLSELVVVLSVPNEGRRGGVGLPCTS